MPKRSLARTIVARVCNEQRNSDLRADDARIIKALDAAFNELMTRERDALAILRRVRRAYRKPAWAAGETEAAAQLALGNFLSIHKLRDRIEADEAAELAAEVPNA